MAFYDTFDRCISVDLYTQSKTFITRVFTPEFGPKPDILVEGEILGASVNISSKVTITNLDASVDANAVKYLVVSMWYGGAFPQKVPYTVIFECLFADDIKQPPDRQTQFNCLTAALGADVMNMEWKYPTAAPATGKVEDVPLTQVCKEWITAYNAALRKTFATPPFNALAPVLANEPKILTATASSETVKFVYGHDSKGSLYGGLLALNNALSATDDDNNVYNAYSINVAQRNLFIVANPAPNAKEGILGAMTTIKDATKVDYILSAYRNGVVLTLSCLFDVEIGIGRPMVIDAGAILGRRVAGTLAGDYLETDKLYFQPTAGIKYRFGTVRENRMDVIGVLYA